eukprot:CAMPEP_0184646518 /NCGR_PEP_ID=MMETSP0308-20130426/3214_1 /TAXON_ID=38269 /ORGANISM="Gloeochaete witrockiana, Strain SAG 46.84" /LENGTH=130 /DNA_ID=CAMNT_0027076585 /DNA_START=53 /DNA_END=445 /DNA_ORIENTATION=-
MASSITDTIGVLDLQFRRLEADLDSIAGKLEAELSLNSSDSTENPLRILHRIRRVQDELPKIQARCESVIASKRRLIDVTEKIIVQNRDALEQMAQRAGIESMFSEEALKSYKDVSSHVKPLEFSEGIEI